jgi:hypothetical protein
LSLIEELLQGSIDMHIHAGPDTKVERRVDALQAGRQAEETGMRAIVLKSHEYPTTPLAYVVNQTLKTLHVFGSITLDLETGGLNIHTLETSAKLGAKIVWMPTFSSAHSMNKSSSHGEGISLVDGDGKLLPVLREILDIVKNYDMILATGHISVAEAFPLVDEAVKKGISKTVITHATFSYSLDEQRRMVDKGAFIEHCFNATMPMRRRDPMSIVEAVRAVGAHHCILSTDFGQAFNPTPAEGMRMMLATLLRCGLSRAELELMVKVNPAKLLNLG